MENILLASTNAPALVAVWLAKDGLTASCIAFAALASFASHLVECHKHGMPGIGFSRESSYALNRVDVAAAFLLALRIAYCYWDILLNPGWALALLASFSLNALSEWDKSPETKTQFMIFHSLWHVSIFLLLSLLVQTS